MAINIYYPISPDSKITSKFGYRGYVTEGASKDHMGVDFSAAVGTPIKAATSGVVTYVGYNKDRGNYIKINDGNGLETIYQHLSKTLVNKGDTVNPLQQIALSGNTGVGTGAHFHFETILNGKNVDPLELLNQAKTQTSSPIEAVSKYTNIDAKRSVNSAVKFLESNWAIVCGVLVALGLLDRIQK